MIRAAPAHVVKSVVMRRLHAIKAAMEEAYEFVKEGNSAVIEPPNMMRPDYHEMISKNFVPIG